MTSTCKITPERANITSRVAPKAVQQIYVARRDREAARRSYKLMQNFQLEINN